MVRCPLCETRGLTKVVRGADERRYFLCGRCALISVDPALALSSADERARYELHESSIEDRGYVQFLGRVVDPMLERIDGRMRGLDYGCGPGPTLSLLLRRRGIACDDYDPFFKAGRLRPPYDFVLSSECFEHFRRPAVLFDKLQQSLNRRRHILLEDI